MKKTTKKPYRMPIAHARFAHMLRALLAHVERVSPRPRLTQDPSSGLWIPTPDAPRGALLDEATAREIAAALYELRALYREQALRHVLPNRRVPVDELQHAVNAQMLVEFHGFDAASAMQAITGNPRNVERGSLARTLRNRRKMVELLGVQPEWKVIEAAAKKKKKAEG